MRPMSSAARTSAVCSHASIPRAEVMALINRVLERAVEETHMLPDMVKWIDNKPEAWYYEAVQEAANSHTYTRIDQVVPGQDFCCEDWIKILTPPGLGGSGEELERRQRSLSFQPQGAACRPPPIFVIPTAARRCACGWNA